MNLMDDKGSAIRTIDCRGFQMDEQKEVLRSLSASLAKEPGLVAVILTATHIDDIKKAVYAGARYVLLTDETEESLFQYAKQRFGPERILRYEGDDMVLPTPDISFSFDACRCNDDGLVPVIVQDVVSGQVLMLAYMNQEAFQRTIDTGRMTYYSRSRQCLWIKGETSGHAQYLQSMHVDCDKDTLLCKVAQIGPACHTGHDSCFYTTIEGPEEDAMTGSILSALAKTIHERKLHPKEGSYTNYLLREGLDKILKKVGEESAEILIAAKGTSKEELISEIGDYMYHLFVLMEEKGIAWDDVLRELSVRHG